MAATALANATCSVDLQWRPVLCTASSDRGNDLAHAHLAMVLQLNEVR
jgi:hypothetical protein